MSKQITVPTRFKSKDCDVCGKSFKGELFDCRLPYGIWGNICRDCFIKQGCSLGVGRGQHYTLEKDQWRKING